MKAVYVYLITIIGGIFLGGFLGIAIPFILALLSGEQAYSFITIVTIPLGAAVVPIISVIIVFFVRRKRASKKKNTN